MIDVGERTSLIEGNKISVSTRLTYALGHVFNDLAAAMWFSYTLLYLRRIALFEAVTAGGMLLLGQIIDAIATPICGILVDRYHDKKTWHVIGSVMVTTSFPVIFGTFVDITSKFATITYVTSITIFQMGWALVQISHLSMIPALSSSPLVRADLTAIRYSAQVGAAVIVFVVAWIVLPTSENSVVRLTQQDEYKFRNIVLICTILGATTTIFFHAFLKARLLEERSTSKSADSTLPNQEPASSFRRFWLGTSLLLRVALLYVASRLFATLTTVYLPLYTEETDVGGKQALATVPLVSYLSSFVTALFFKYINKSCGTKACYLLGILLGILSSVVTEFVESNTLTVYAVALLIGAGSSVTMVTALTVTADLIGSRTERSALVYSVVTFLDKVVSGLVVVLIEKLRCRDQDICPDYSRNTLAIVCASSMILGLVTLMSVSRCLN